MQLERVKISSLHLDPSNARKHSPRNIDSIKASLAKFGQQKPIVVTTDDVIIAGNGTLSAAVELGWDDIDIHRTVLKGAEAIAYALADNKTAELAEWDVDILSAQLKALDADGWELEPLGFDLDTDILDSGAGGGGLTDDDEVPDVEQNIHGVELGDVWQLGEHRVMCGDSTSADSVAQLMDGAKADMVFTDPPYGMSLDTDWSHIGENLKEGRTNSASDLSIKNTKASSAKKYKKVENDDKPFDPSFVLESFDYCDVVLWGVDYYFDKLPDNGTVFVWNKIQNDNGAGVSWSIGSEFELGWINRKARKKCFTELWSGLFGTEKQDVRKRIHPNQKPLGLIEKCLAEYSPDKNLIIDLFLGSGSTLIACEKTGRKCYGMEIDPHYCSVIIERWQNFTGNQATKC